ncbi:MAG: hypothetical protein LUH03_04925 [Oscillospiraceae bacterium]|nr:hypothetical protein [Oscillospiraceae bacterium]
MDLNQLKRIDELPHLASLTIEELYAELPLYERVLITTCDVTYDEVTAEEELLHICVSKDVNFLHDFCQGTKPINIPCYECKADRTFNPRAGWNPRNASDRITNGNKSSKQVSTNKVTISRQYNQMTRNGNGSNHPCYRYGVNHLADIDYLEVGGIGWGEFIKECGNQCMSGILKEISEFRKDIECTYDSEHKGFADFIIVPAVPTKPVELKRYEQRLNEEKNKAPNANVERSNGEMEAEELYNKYCRALLIIKVGQYPALRDTQLFDTKKYRNILNENYKYYTLSISLYSEGVGIGAFVYLRRILEDIVEEVHQQCVAECNKRNSDTKLAFDEAKYQSLHFNEKISYLENTYNKVIIPAEVEQVREKLYGVLSKGVHESSEEECLELYPYVRCIIEVFLDDIIQRKERKKKIDLAMKKLQSSNDR